MENRRLRVLGAAAFRSKPLDFPALADLLRTMVGLSSPATGVPHR